jgi:hypothetical protein
MTLNIKAMGNAGRSNIPFAEPNVGCSSVTLANLLINALLRIRL